MDDANTFSRYTENPLGYLLGLQGMALLRAFAGRHDAAFTEARIEEIRRLLDEDALADRAVAVDRLGFVDGYAEWASTYDDGRNALFDIDEPVVLPILESLPPGTAVDAACGTGRYAEHLAALGHRVFGVDGSPAMVRQARSRVPGAEFREGELRGLPIDDDSADLVVCALALTHVPELAPVFAEFARVLRPGGSVVIADSHRDSVLLGSIPTVRGPGGGRGRLTGYPHLAGDYLRAALPLGFTVRRCEEPTLPAGPPRAATAEPGPWDLWPWSLAAMVPEAAAAANADRPAAIVWHFTLDAEIAGHSS